MSDWFNTDNLPAARAFHRLLQLNGYIYAIGGTTNPFAVSSSAVSYATVNADGSVTGAAGVWQATSALPAARDSGHAFTLRHEANALDYLVYAGGTSGGAPLSTVYFTTQGANGALNAWSTAGSNLPAIRARGVVATIANRVFIIGGDNGSALATVITNTIEGIVAGTAWTTLSALSNIPGATRRAAGACDGRVVFVAGGEAGGTASLSVYRGIISEAVGVPSIAWEVTTPLPRATQDAAAICFDHHFYVAGGHDGTFSGTGDFYQIARAPVLGDGQLGDWQYISEALTSYSGGTLRSTGMALAITGRPADQMLRVGGRLALTANSHIASCYREDTPTFWKLANRSDKVEVVRKLHIYLDGAIYARMSDRPFYDATGEDHDVILRQIGAIERGLGSDRIPSSADVEVILDNNEQLADWLVDHDTAEESFGATVRMFIGARREVGSISGQQLIAWMQLGEYYVSTQPKRTLSTVSFGCTENIRGVLIDVLPTITIRDWIKQATSPVTAATQLIKRVTIPDEILDTPIPMVFGSEQSPGIRLFYGVPKAINGFTDPADPATFSESLWFANYNARSEVDFGLAYVLAVTRNPATPILQRAFIAYRKIYDGQQDVGGPFASQMVNYHVDAGTDILEVPLFRSVYANTTKMYPLRIRSSAVTVAGSTWYVHWVACDSPAVRSGSFFNAQGSGGWGGFASNGELASQYIELFEAEVNRISAASFVWSPASGMGTPSSTATKQTPEQIIRDLVGSYMSAGHAYLDEASLVRVEKALHRDSAAAGRVGQGQQVRMVLGELFASWDIDGYADLSGRLAITGNLRDYSSQSVDPVGLYEIYEEDVSGVEEQRPTDGERWAIANRIYLDGIKPAIFGPVAAPGPYTNTETLLRTRRFVEQRINVAWRTNEDAVQDPWKTRALDSTPRNIITFRLKHLGGLRLDLGSYFRFSWTRNQASPYVSAIFKVEQMSVDPSSLKMTISAVWVDDLISAQPFLLDQRSKILSAEGDGTFDGSLGGFVDMTNGVSQINMNAALIAGYGIQIGDWLVLRSTVFGNPIYTPFTTQWGMNRAVRISNVNVGLGIIETDDPDLTWHSSGGAVSGEWEIRRGFDTTPPVSTPDYPSGGQIYGKISSPLVSPTYGDGSPAHVLLDG